jgi:Ser/Thr protein kinase RdoA (MazF antagonist)
MGVVHAKNQKSTFYDLHPELVLQATEAAGFVPTGEFTQLNSYENRVFDVRLEGERKSVIAKFYRPGRWSPEGILEEHAFLQELHTEDLSVAWALPQKNSHNATLSLQSGLWVAFFEKIRGRMTSEFSLKDLELLGKKLAQLHNVGARKSFRHRPILAEEPMDPYEVFENLKPRIAQEMLPRYEAAVKDLLRKAQDNIDPDSFQRIHGDCHRGNILHNGQSGPDTDFFFVDFDDCMMGPVVQDIWLLFSSGEAPSLELTDEQESLLKGYREFRIFPMEQLKWVPLLRGLRIFQYAAWIASRWTDPSFPRIFPQFGSYNYWAEETEALEKVARQSSLLTPTY